MYTSDKEDNNLLSRAEDVLNLSEIRGKPCYLGFLNEKEQYLISRHFSYAADRITFFGGYTDAARKVMRACDYEIIDDDYQINKLCFKFRSEDSLSHRDFLGALMSLGIERSCVGDIIVDKGCAAVFVKQEISGFIESQLTKIGRVGVHIVSDDECDISYKRCTETLSLIVSSMRLDAVVAAAARLSRGKSASLIQSSKVFVNYSEINNVSYILKPDDILTIRGSGKFVIKDQLSTTKKGRLKINIEQYR